MAKRTNRVAWVMVVVLALALMGVCGLTVIRLRPYWVAKYHGERASLRSARLGSAPLWRANLAGADMEAAVLRGADLTQARLTCARLRRADLRSASLRGAGLQGVDLTAADLRDAVLQRAVLNGLVSLSCKGSGRRTTLEFANLCGADFRRAALIGVPLTGARYDRHTRWPSGFDPVKAGALFVR
jgi:pentapeptide repeat protein